MENVLDERLMLDAEAVRRLFGWPSRNQVYMAVRRGQLPARKWGRRVVFLKTEVEAYLAQLPFAHLPRVSQESVARGAR